MRIRQCRSRRLYLWRLIERFEVGNPSSPRLAYLLLKPSLDPADLRRGPVVELPYLYSPTPEEVVERLAEAQHLFGRPASMT